jgi:hypothetical protein
LPRWPTAFARAEEARALADMMKGETANTCLKIADDYQMPSSAGSKFVILEVVDRVKIGQIRLRDSKGAPFGPA